MKILTQYTNHILKKISCDLILKNLVLYMGLVTNLYPEWQWHSKCLPSDVGRQSPWLLHDWCWQGSEYKSVEHSSIFEASTAECIKFKLSPDTST